MASKVVDMTEEVEGAAAVHRLQPQMPKTCYRCGWSGHSPTECRFKEAKCFACKKVGHLSQVCTSKGQGKKSSRIMKAQPKPQIHIRWNEQRMTKKHIFRAKKHIPCKQTQSSSLDDTSENKWEMLDNGD